jgi:hypothetical protein
MMQAAEMNLMEAVLGFDKGDLTTGAQTLMQGIRVHRRFLADSSLLVSRMIAVAMLRRDYAVLSAAIEHWPPLTRQAVLAPAWQPLGAREYDLRPALQSETIARAHTLSGLIQSQQKLGWYAFVKQSLTEGITQNRQLLGIPWHATLLSYFVLPHATLNLLVRWLDAQARAISGDAAAIEARHAAQAARQTRAFDQIAPWASWRFIRNPGGKVLLKIYFGDLGPDPLAYAERIHDLGGYIRLVALQAALRRDGVPQTEAAGYVQRAGPDLRNPYDGQPMRWDAASATLSFEGRQKNSFNPDDAPHIFSVRLKFDQAKAN